MISLSTETVSSAFSSTSWSDVHNVVALTNRLGTGITRSNSTFTFTEGGTYLISASFNPDGQAHYFGLRMRRLTGTQTTLIQRTTSTGSGSTPDQAAGDVMGLFQVAANDAVSLQYVVKSGTPNTWGASNPLDGESMVTGHVDIWKISP